MSEKFVIFDLDDTLVDYAVAIKRALVQFAEDRALGSEGLKFLFEINTLPWTVEATWEAIRSHFDIPESATNLELLFAETLPLLTEPVEAAAPGLKMLREAGWIIALLTNGAETDQRAKLRDGMAAYFDALHFCDDSGPRKPDVAAFREVARRAQAALKGAWMVGDSLSSDIAGGAAAGMTTVWISHGRKLPRDAPRPDFVARSLEDAFSILMRS